MAKTHLHIYGSKHVKVSTQWLVVLRAADARHIPFVVNSGARTRAEQEAQIAAHGCWSPSNPHGAACPWWKSNHVIKGHMPNHALDVDSASNGENRLQAWLNSHKGVSATNPVPGEAWHLEINRAGLLLLYLKYRRPVVQHLQRTSRKGREFLAREEGVVLHAYNDPVGHCTVGVGHLIHLGHCNSADFIRWGVKDPTTALGKKLARARMMRLLKADLKEREALVRSRIGRKMYQHRFDAVISLLFNIGAGNFSGSTVAQRIHDRASLDSIEEAWLRWSRAGANPTMLLPRRKREVKLFRTGRYS